MRIVVILILFAGSLQLVAEESTPAITRNFLGSLFEFAQKLGTQSIEDAACSLRKSALKSVDGLTVSVSADLLKLLPATRLLPASVSGVGEIAAFYRPGSDHIDIQGFLVPSAAVGHQADAPLRKVPGDVNLGLTFGCQGNPSNYEGYFATLGVGPMNLNLGLDLTEMFTNMMVASNPDFNPKTVADYEAFLRNAKADGIRARETLAGYSDGYLGSFRSRFLPGTVNHPGRLERGEIPRSEVFSEMRDYSKTSLEEAGKIEQLYRDSITRMERNLGKNDITENLEILSGVDQFYEDSGSFLSKSAQVTFPFTIKKAEREYTAKLLNTQPKVSGKTFSSVSWRRFYLSDEDMVAEGLGSREMAHEEAKAYFRNGSYLCKRENRFVTFHLEYQYRASDIIKGYTPPLLRRTEPMVYDCLTGRMLSNRVHLPSLDNFGEVRKLISAHKGLLKSADGNLKGIQGLQLVLNQTYADYRLKSRVEPRKLQIGGYHGRSALTGCNSVTVSMKDSISQLSSLMGSAGTLTHSVMASVPKNFSQVKGAVQGGLKALGKVSASVSASHYYPVGPNYKVALKDLPIWFVRLLKGQCGEGGRHELAQRNGGLDH